MKCILLSSAKENEEAIIEDIKGLPFERLKRLLELGFTKGTKIRVLKNLKKAGEMMVLIRSYSLAIDYFVASKIAVMVGDK